MSVNGYIVRANGHNRTFDDYGYVNIMSYRDNKQKKLLPHKCNKIEVMWADESVYGPPAPGSKVGDFIMPWLVTPQCGVFTHREIAERLVGVFSGLKIAELQWFENPKEKKLKNGKPRVRRPKWLPEHDVDLVYLYSDHYINARDPAIIQTDFFIVTRSDSWGESVWFMCTIGAAQKLKAMDFENLDIEETTIKG